MKLVKMYRSRKYLLRILLSISLLMSVMLIVSSILQYYNSRQMVLEKQLEMNRKILYQVEYNINYMNELVKTMTMSMYFDPDTIALMNSRTFDIFDLSPKLNRLYKNVNSSAFIHSILIYNAYNGCYYTTESKLSCEEDGLEQAMDRYLNDRNQLPRLKFVPFSLTENSAPNGRVDMFSYFMYEATDESYNKQSTFIINIKPEWLFNNMDAINRLTGHQESRMFIVDRSGRLLNPDLAGDAVEEHMIAAIRHHLSASNMAIDSFIERIGNEKKYITYMNSGINDWIIVNVQSYDTVLGSVDKMRTNSIAMIVIFLLVSMLISLGVSFKLYQPIERMLRQIRRSPYNEHDKKDELTFISDAYRQVFDRVEQFQSDQNTQSGIVRAYHLRKLIADSSLVSLPEFTNDLEPVRLRVNLNDPLALFILKLDNYAEFVAGTSVSDKKLLKFAIGNIVEELTGACYKYEIVDMRNDHFVILINTTEPEMVNGVNLAELLQMIQDHVRRYYRISLTAAISQPMADYRDITRHYAQTMEYSMYRIVHGKSAIITLDKVRANIDNKQFKFPAELEKKWCEALKANDLTKAEKCLNALMQDISRLNYNNITHSIFQMVVTVHNTINEINQYQLNPIAIDMQSFYHKIQGLETLDEINLLFGSLFRRIGEKRKGLVEDSKNDNIADTIIEIIEKNYSDFNLSLQSIAEIMKMPSAHISKIFRNREGVSVSEYITNARLNLSLNLLENHAHSINEVMEKVGLLNQSYFFRLFKKRFGMTPKEYRVNKLFKKYML